MNTRAMNVVTKRNHWGKLFFDLLQNIDFGNAVITCPDGAIYNYQGKVSSNGSVDIHIHDWRFCEYIFTKGDIGLGEAYIKGYWSSSNISDLIEFGVANEKSLESVIKGSIVKIIFYRIKHFLNRNTIKGSKKNIHAHYDLGNEFYKLWLDKTMTYSSALYLENPNLSLEQAQIQKYQRIFDQLDIKEDSHILEIGCGWGGFAEYACSRGAKVTGVTISKEQYDFAKKRLNGLGDRAEILLKDYREIEGKFDHIVSIEMFEALGESYWGVYFDKVRSLLSSKGKAVIQSITIKDDIFKSYRKSTDFIQQYIFPGGMLPSPEVFINKAQKKNLTLLNRVDFGLDYAKTLNEWHREFNAKIDSVKSMKFDDEFIRTWNFYLKYCEGGFKTNRIGVSQFTLEINDEA